MPVDNEDPFEFDVIAHQPSPPNGLWKVAIGSIPAGQIMSAANARTLAAALVAAADTADGNNA